MRNIPIIWVNTWQEAHSAYPDEPVILVLVRDTNNTIYMRYHGEFHRVDEDSYHIDPQSRWCVAGVGFSYNSVQWMINNSMAFPFTAEDLVLYYMTWGDVCA